MKTNVNLCFAGHLLKESPPHYKKQPLLLCRASLQHLWIKCQYNFFFAFRTTFCRLAPILWANAEIPTSQKSQSRPAEIFQKQKLSHVSDVPPPAPHITRHSHCILGVVIYPSVAGRCSSRWGAGKGAAGSPPCGLYSSSTSGNKEYIGSRVGNSMFIWVRITHDGFGKLDFRL